MEITPQQARQELARRELARRQEAKQPAETPAQKQNFGQAFGKMAGETLRRSTQAGPAGFLNVTGGPGTQLAHDAKAVAMEKMGAHPIVAEAGAGATDPQSIFLEMMGAAKLMPGIAKRFGRKSAQATSEAERLTESLLKPNQKQFASEIKRGGTKNEVSQAAKYIQPAKDYTEVTDQLEFAKGFPAEARNQAYQGKQVYGDRSQLDPLLQVVQAERQAAQGAPKASLFSRILDAEVDFLNKQDPSSFDAPQFYQRRKQYYQKLADEAGAYKGRDAKMTSKAEAYRKLAEGYQNKLYSVDEAVKPLNLEYAGLEEAGDRASQLAAIERGSTPTGVPEELIQAVQGSKLGIAGKLINKLLGKPVERMTRGISKASKRADKFAQKQQVIEGWAGQPELPEEAILEYPLGLPEPPPKPQGQLAAPSRRSQIAKALPPGQGSGPPIRVPGSSTIYIPETLESDLQALMQKFGVDPRNVRSSTPIEGPRGSSQIPKESYRNMTAKERSSLRELMKRRKRNFGGNV